MLKKQRTRRNPEHFFWLRLGRSIRSLAAVEDGLSGKHKNRSFALSRTLQQNYFFYQGGVETKGVNDNRHKSSFYVSICQEIFFGVASRMWELRSATRESLSAVQRIVITARIIVPDFMAHFSSFLQLHFLFSWILSHGRYSSKYYSIILMTPANASASALQMTQIPFGSDHSNDSGRPRVITARWWNASNQRSSGELARNKILLAVFNSSGAGRKWPQFRSSIRLKHRHISFFVRQGLLSSSLNFDLGILLPVMMLGLTDFATDLVRIEVDVKGSSIEWIAMV